MNDGLAHLARRCRYSYRCAAGSSRSQKISAGNAFTRYTRRGYNATLYWPSLQPSRLAPRRRRGDEPSTTSFQGAMADRSAN